MSEDKLLDAKKQGQAQFDSIREMVEALQAAEGGSAVTNDRGEEQDVDSCRQRIEEYALSVEVRSGWYVVGAAGDEKPAEYRILLCTGGPACQITGQLSEHGEPETARMEVQDWFQPWTPMRPIVGKRINGAYGVEVEVDDYDSEPTLLAYARVFWLGE